MEKIDLYQSTILLGILEFLDFFGVRGYFYLRNSKFLVRILDFGKNFRFCLGILEFLPKYAAKAEHI